MRFSKLFVQIMIQYSVYKVCKVDRPYGTNVFVFPTTPKYKLVKDMSKPEKPEEKKEGKKGRKGKK